MTIETHMVADDAGAQPPDRATRVLVGDLRTGQILDELDATACVWHRQVNDPGRITATVPAEVLRSADVRSFTQPARRFVAFEADGRIWQAGPIWSRRYSRKRGSLTLTGAGLWSVFDHRRVMRVLAPAEDPASVTMTASATTLGGIARYLVDLAEQHYGGDLPVVLPAAPSGTRTESWQGYHLTTIGEQLRQLTRRETAAPDIRFAPRRRADDETYIEWVLQIGTEAEPELVQAGDDWWFDDAVGASPVVDIEVDDDASDLVNRAWLTGSGMERDSIITFADDPSLVDLGWPLLEDVESRPTVGETDRVAGAAELGDRAVELLARRGRPAQAWKVDIRVDAAREVSDGDYCRLVVGDDPFLPAGEHRCRVLRIGGDLDDTLTLTMQPTTGVL